MVIIDHYLKFKIINSGYRSTIRIHEASIELFFNTYYPEKLKQFTFAGHIKSFPKIINQSIIMYKDMFQQLFNTKDEHIIRELVLEYHKQLGQ